MSRGAISINLVRTVFTSEYVPLLFTGEETHGPALRFVGQLSKHLDNDDIISSLIAAAPPESYSSDTMKELPAMIAGAKQKGFDKPLPKSEKFLMTDSGLKLTKVKGRTVFTVEVSDPFEILGLVRDTESVGWARMLRWRDADGYEHEFIANDKLLLVDHETVCGDMAEQGLRIAKGQQGNLARYILDTKTDVRVTLVLRIGWHKMRGRLVFVLPAQVIGEAPGAPCLRGWR